MFGWLKGKSVDEDVNTMEQGVGKVLSRLLDKLDELSDTLADMESRIVDLDNKVNRLSSPAERVQHDLADAKAQMRQSNEFMQNLVLQLIEAPPKVESVVVEKTPSSALKDYLAKKAANGSDHKPKLP